jgi:hypothetical protein
LNYLGGRDNHCETCCRASKFTEKRLSIYTAERARIFGQHQIFFIALTFYFSKDLEVSIPKSVMLSLAATLLLMGHAFSSPVELEERQSCPNIHVFGARETTVAQGYGTAGVVVNLILNAQPGATSEAIVYPACGGQSSCGGVSYASSAVQGVAAVASQVNAFNTKCPNTQLVLVGYSQVSSSLRLSEFEHRN